MLYTRGYEHLPWDPRTSYTHPDRTGEIREHAALEPGLFALGGHSLVHALAQPHVRLYVPRIDEPLEVFRNLDLPYVDVRRAVPGGDARRPIAGESKAGEDARAFGQDPHAVVLGALDKASNLDDEDPVGVIVRRQSCWGKLGMAGEKTRPNEPVWQALFGEPICQCGVERDFGCDAHVEPEVPQGEQHLAVCGAFTPVGDRSAMLRLRATTCDVEHRALDQRRVRRIFKIRADEDAWEV